MARNVTIETSTDIDIAEYIDRLTDEEITKEVSRRKYAKVAKDSNGQPAVGGNEMSGPDDPEYWLLSPDYVEQFEAIRDAIKTRGSDAAMELVRKMICEELGCIL